MTQGNKDGIKVITAKIRNDTANATNAADIAHECDLIDEQIDAEPTE